MVWGTTYDNISGPGGPLMWNINGPPNHLCQDHLCYDRPTKFSPLGNYHPYSTLTSNACSEANRASVSSAPICMSMRLYKSQLQYAVARPFVTRKGLATLELRGLGRVVAAGIDTEDHCHTFNLKMASRMRPVLYSFSV